MTEEAIFDSEACLALMRENIVNHIQREKDLRRFVSWVEVLEIIDNRNKQTDQEKKTALATLNDVAEKAKERKLTTEGD